MCIPLNHVVADKLSLSNIEDVISYNVISYDNALSSAQNERMTATRDELDSMATNYV